MSLAQQSCKTIIQHKDRAGGRFAFGEHEANTTPTKLNNNYLNLPYTVKTSDEIY